MEQASALPAVGPPSQALGILDTIRDAFIVLDRQWRYAYVNQPAERMIGKPRERLLGKTLWEVWGEDPKLVYPDAFRKAMSENTSVEFEEFFPATESWFGVRASPTAEGLLVHFRDITGRKRAESNAAMTDERLALAVEASQLGTFYWDLAFNKLVWNDKGKEYFGLRRDAEVTIDLFYALLHPDDRQHTRQAIEHAIHNRTGYDIDYRTVGADGSVRWLRSVGRGIYDRDGNATRFDGITIDVTEHAQLEIELRQAKEAAEAANKAKDEFLATVSHELRTPLNAILGWVQLLRMGAVEDDQETFDEALEKIERNAKTQGQLIEDILDVSRIINGKLRVEQQPVQLRQVVDAAFDAVKPTADAKSLQLDYQAEPDNLWVCGDAGRLRQVVSNLLNNAVKFTPQGGSVTLRLDRVQSCARVSVTDSGRGIKTEFLPHVFERFRQADSSSTRQHSGLGLGLAIVRHLVELHGGTVRAQSEGEGRGACFTVLLPVMAVLGGEQTIAGAAAPAGPTLVSLAGVRVLAVDDDGIARDLVSTVLQTCGANVTVACNATEAFEVFSRMRPDVLLSDIAMPSVDGYSLIRQVRQLPEAAGGKTPALALTAYASLEDRTRALTAGFDEHVAKPVEPSELSRLIAILVGRAGKK